MKFIPIGMADMSRRLRPQADTAGIGTRKLFFDPGRGRRTLAPLSECKKDYSISRLVVSA